MNSNYINELFVSFFDYIDSYRKKHSDKNSLSQIIIYKLKDINIY